MCPSYMATREEMHSTRGRAHLLWEALSGNGLLEGGLADPALKEALELCLSCKACKTECPAAIDMAAYKAEFFAQYYQHHRRPLDVRFFARIHESPASARSRRGSPTRSRMRPAWARSRGALLSVHPDRELPRFAARDVSFMVRGVATPADANSEGARSCSFPTPSTISSSPRSRSPRPKCWSARASRS